MHTILDNFLKFLHFSASILSCDLVEMVPVFAANDVEDGQLPVVFLGIGTLFHVESTRAWHEGLPVCLSYFLLPRLVVIALLVFFRASEDRRLTRGPGGSEITLQSSADFFKDLSFPIGSCLFVFTLSPSTFGRLEEGSSCTNESIDSVFLCKRVRYKRSFSTKPMHAFLKNGKVPLSRNFHSTASSRHLPRSTMA
jgi:hypothetical protein